MDFDNKSSSKIFGKSSACPAKASCGTEEGLGKDGSPIEMQKEMEKEAAASLAPSQGSGKKGGKKSSAKKESGGAKKSAAKKGKK